MILFDCQGAHVEIRGFGFRYAATHAQLGAVVLHGRGNVLEDCVVERTSGVGVVFQGTDQAARRCHFEENGALGKPSQAEGDDQLSEQHEVLEVPGKPSQAEGGDEA